MTSTTKYLIQLTRDDGRVCYATHHHLKNPSHVSSPYTPWSSDRVVARRYRPEEIESELASTIAILGGFHSNIKRVVA